MVMEQEPVLPQAQINLKHKRSNPLDGKSDIDHYWWWWRLVIQRILKCLICADTEFSLLERYLNENVL